MGQFFAAALGALEREQDRWFLWAPVLLGCGIACYFSLTFEPAPLAAAGTLYGVLAAGLRVRETLLPILLLPVLAPVLIGATKAFEAALGGAVADGWPWCGLLVSFALLYTAAGTLAFGTLLEEA